MTSLHADAPMFIKICGLTSPEDAGVCAEAGATAIGVNFWPKSKRYHSLEDAVTWLPEFAGGPVRIALFVNAELADIQAAVDSALFEAIQLHGDESPEFCARVRVLGLPVIRGLSLHAGSDISILENHPADAFILDAFLPGHYGGTGKLGHWGLAAEAVRLYPDKTLILAGGLTPENVAAALREVGSFGVDVASGVESSPGKKDHAEIRAFIAAARAAHPGSLLPGR